MLSRFCCRFSQGPGNEVPVPALSVCALGVPVCRVAPGFPGCGSRASRILPPCCLWRRCCPPRVARGARLDAAVPLLPLSFSSLSIPRGFLPLPRNALSDIGSAPSCFCLAVLAWQAGELGVPTLDVAMAPARSRCRSKTWRRHRGTAGTPHFLHPALWHAWLALLPRPRVSHLFLFHGRGGWDRPIPHRGRPEARAWPGAADGACLLFLPRKRPSPPGDAAAPERLEALKYQRIKKPKKSSKGSSKSRKQPSECEDLAVPNSVPCVLL